MTAGRNPAGKGTGMQIKRGDIYYADLTPVVGSEQGGTRPVLIIQNDMGNRHSPTVIAAAITSRRGKKPLPTHIRLEDSPCGLEQESTVLLEQVRTIDRARLKEYIGRAGRATMRDVDHAIAVSFGLDGILFLQEGRATQAEKETGAGTAGRNQARARDGKGAAYERQETGMGLLLN